MRFNNIISKTDEFEFINHLMRAGNISSSEFYIMMEAHHCVQQRLLLENVNDGNVRFFQVNGDIDPVIGEEYWIVPIYCIGDNVYVYDSSFVTPPHNEPVKRKLVSSNGSEYKIEINNKVVDFPNKKLTDMAYATVIFFDDPIQYNKLSTALAVGFDINLPRISESSNEMTEDIDRRGFLKGLGAAAGIGTLGYGAVQQKKRPWDTVGEPTRDENRSDRVRTEPQTPSAPTVAKQRVPKYSPEILKQYIIDYARKTLPHNQVAPFVSQLDHESHGFRSMEEILNYTAPVLSRKYPKLFPSNIAKKVVEHPLRDQIIANKIYANRNGNGDYESGDGYRYRGRGFIQLTGRENYETFGDLIGVDLVNNPDLAAKPEYAAQIALSYWKRRVVKNGKIGNNDQITKKISGSSKQGIKSRNEKLEKYRKELNNYMDKKGKSK